MKDTTTKILNAVKSLEKKADDLHMKTNDLAAKSQERHTGVLATGQAPFARKGESALSSRGFSFSKLVGHLGKNGSILAEDCKIELDLAHRWTKKMTEAGYRPSFNNSIMLPLDVDLFPESIVDNREYHEIKGLMTQKAVDPDEMAWTLKKTAPVAASPAQSWIDQSVGGSFVPPPTFSNPIELLRNKSALMDDCQIVPLGPSGRMICPRLTAATQVSWSPENNPITPTTAQTGQLELSAKKTIGVVVLPGELLRFGSPATEAMIRNDLFKSVSLLADKGFLEGPGSGQQPLGLATMCFATGNPYGCAIVTPSATNNFAAQDAYQFLAAIEENNGEPDLFIMRPKMAYGWYQARWTPFSSGTNQGGFLFEYVRDLNKGPVPYLAGVKVNKTVQVSNFRGAANQTYVLCISSKDILIGLFGSIEFTQSDGGYNLLASDQVAIRAILSSDIGPKHPSIIAGADQVAYTVQN
jgi:HK97 family phage major capsid protein